MQGQQIYSNTLLELLLMLFSGCMLNCYDCSCCPVEAAILSTNQPTFRAPSRKMAASFLTTKNNIYSKRFASSWDVITFLNVLSSHRCFRMFPLNTTDNNHSINVEVSTLMPAWKPPYFESRGEYLTGDERAVIPNKYGDSFTHNGEYQMSRKCSLTPVCLNAFSKFVKLCCC